MAKNRLVGKKDVVACEIQDKVLTLHSERGPVAQLDRASAF